MSDFQLLPSAERRVDEIYEYSFDHWGKEKAQAYVNGMFDCFAAIARGDRHSRQIPKEHGVKGFYARYHSHLIYWRRRPDGVVSIVTVLHQSMNQSARLIDDTA